MTYINNNNSWHDYNGMPVKEASSPEDFKKNLEYLYEKINLKTKSLSSWDLYRISTVLNQETEFNSSINKLLPYTSLILNTRVNDLRYGVLNVGDLILKTNDGKYEHIKAERGGIFYPSSITKTYSDEDKSYSYEFNFKYGSVAPDKYSTLEIEQDEESKSWIVPENEYAAYLNFVNLKGGTAGSPYNAVYKKTTWSDITVNGELDSDGDNYISPIVKFYTTTTKGDEEIYMDHAITINNGVFTISGHTNCTLLNKVVVK